MATLVPFPLSSPLEPAPSVKTAFILGLDAASLAMYSLSTDKRLASGTL